MNLPLYLVDAFTSEPFRGNPAGVCLLDGPVPDELCQRLAAEMNQAETAFLQPASSEGWNLRWFTPTVEVDLCGHATLASAHVLWSTQRVPAHRDIAFHTRSGTLICRRIGESIEMDFPSEAVRPTAEDPREALALRRPPIFVGRNRMDLLVALDSPADLHAIVPDALQLCTIPARGIIVTAPSDRPGIDFVSRFFAPQSGVLEDAVTGSTHCALAPYWRDVLGRNELIGYQASPRGGRVRVRCAGNRVFLAGEAVTIVEGKVRVDRPMPTSNSPG